MSAYYTQDVSTIVESSAPLGETDPVDHPSGYLPDQGLVAAVNVALTLGKPLLLTGEPGTGKTQLAHSLAWQLAARRQLNVRTRKLEKFETKSTSLSRDLFYTFDAIARFQAARETTAPATVPPGNAPVSTAALSNAPFITYNALGRALIAALEPKHVPPKLRLDLLDKPPTRTVVLIDEIDKAPRDFPNDLLNEIEHMYFRIPELDNTQVGGPDVIGREMRPIVVITSNSEKNLPDPFLRRCIYYHIPFPSAPALREILLKRVAQFTTTQGPLFDDALAFFQRVRERGAAKRKASPAELIEWLTFMLKSGADATSRLADVKELAIGGLGALVKEPNDQDTVPKELDSFLAGR